MLQALPDASSALSLNDAVAKLKQDEEGRLAPGVFCNANFMS